MATLRWPMPGTPRSCVSSAGLRAAMAARVLLSATTYAGTPSALARSRRQSISRARSGSSASVSSAIAIGAAAV